MKTTKLSIVWKFVVLLLLQISINAETFYVSTNGSDGNAGSQELPFATLGKALTSVAPGDIIRLGQGTFGGGNTSIAGLEGSLITIEGDGTNTVIDSQLTIDLPCYRIQQIKFVAKTVCEVGGFNIFDGCTYTGMTLGISLKSPSNEVVNCEFYSLVGNAMIDCGGETNYIHNNIFRDSGGWDALRVFGNNHVIRSNQFLRIISDQEATGGNHADIVQSFTYPTTNVVFEQNWIEDCTSQLANLENDSSNTAQHSWVFRNNIIVNSRIQINNYTPNLMFYNNTVFNAPFDTGVRAAGDESSTKGIGTIRVFNNILCRVGTSESNGAYSGSPADYNFLSDVDDTAKTYFTETHGINGGYTPEQIFMDPANKDFRLKPGCPLIVAGTNLAVYGFSYDYTGSNRGPQWDIGAYEFVSSGINSFRANQIRANKILKR